MTPNIDLSILNDIVKEVIGKTALEPTEPAEEADATPEHDRQTKMQRKQPTSRTRRRAQKA